MCQLTYSNLHNKLFNTLMVYILGRIGSEKHDDGCGFMCSDDSIWRTKLAAKNITNLGKALSLNINGDEPIPFHIRMATYGIEVSDENAHPFIGDHFILMHNGTLLPRDGKEPDDKKKDSDSLRFLNELDRCRNENPDGTFENIFNSAMANFAGKFAFIIRERETGIDYIIRGRTAELWISEVTYNGNKAGFVVNTSRETLSLAIHEFINTIDIIQECDISFSKPILLGQEKIFLAMENSLKEVGNCVETTPVTVVRQTAALPAPKSTTTNWENSYHNTDMSAILEKAIKIYQFIWDHSMSLLDYQLLIMVSSGISILEITEKEVNEFIEQVIPKISASRKVREQVKRILDGKLFPSEVYDKYQLEYPWTVNDGEKVIKALKSYYLIG